MFFSAFPIKCFKPSFMGLGLFMCILLASAWSYGQGYSTIHFYREFSKAEVKGDFELFINDKRVGTIPIGARIELEMYTQGTATLHAQLTPSGKFSSQGYMNRDCSTLPVVIDVVHGGDYYFDVNGINCHMKEAASKQLGKSAFARDYNFKGEIMKMKEILDSPYPLEPLRPQAKTQLVNNSSAAASANTLAASTAAAASSATKIIESDVDRNIPTTGKSKPMTFALVIGNEDYSTYQSGLSTESNVDFAVRDAQIFKQYLVKTMGVPERNVILLENATSGKMNQSIAKLVTLASKTNGQAELIFYYAGHGLPHEQTKEPYLVPVDVTGNGLEYGGIKITDLYAQLNEYPTKRVSVFMDACFTGGARNQGLVAARGVRVKAKSEEPMGNLVVFSASSGEQSSLPYKDKGHGIFTYFLLKKLQESEGEVTYSELADYVKKNVSLNSVLINSKEQDPQTNVSPGVVESWGGWKL